MLYSAIGPRSGSYPKSPIALLHRSGPSHNTLNFRNVAASRSIAAPTFVSGPNRHYVKLAGYPNLIHKIRLHPLALRFRPMLRPALLRKCRRAVRHNPFRNGNFARPFSQKPSAGPSARAAPYRPSRVTPTIQFLDCATPAPRKRIVTSSPMSYPR